MPGGLIQIVAYTQGSVAGARLYFEKVLTVFNISGIPHNIGRRKKEGSDRFSLVRVAPVGAWKHDPFTHMDGEEASVMWHCPCACRASVLCATALQQRRACCVSTLARICHGF